MKTPVGFTPRRYGLYGTVCAAAALMFVLTTTSLTSGDEPQETPERGLSLVSQEDVWRLLPPCEHGSDQPVPDWVRVLVTSMPYTTASMLELDTIYRTSEELNPAFRARLRWVAAHENGCQYTRRYAESDMKRAGMSVDQVAQFTAGEFALSSEESRALQFVRDLTRRAYRITDEQFSALSADFGERGAMAIVLQTAYASFQDRMMQTLGVAVEPQGPLAPLDVRFTPPGTDQKITMSRPEIPDAATLPAPVLEIPEDWRSAFSIEQLNEGMKKQKAKRERISIPEWEVVQPRIPQHIYPVKKPVRIRWSLCVLGHQPILGAAWLRTMRVWGRESGSDSIFNESLFWVVTRNLQCFY